MIVLLYSCLVLFGSASFCLDVFLLFGSAAFGFRLCPKKFRIFFAGHPPWLWQMARQRKRLKHNAIVDHGSLYNMIIYDNIHICNNMYNIYIYIMYHINK